MICSIEKYSFNVTANDLQKAFPWISEAESSRSGAPLGRIPVPSLCGCGKLSCKVRWGCAYAAPATSVQWVGSRVCLSLPVSLTAPVNQVFFFLIRKNLNCRLYGQETGSAALEVILSGLSKPWTQGSERGRGQSSDLKSTRALNFKSKASLFTFGKFLEESDRQQGSLIHNWTLHNT